MAKIRVLFFLLMIVVVGTLGYMATLYARGYRLNTKTLRFTPSGLLVVNSEPKGAQVYVNGNLNTATDATINLPPGTYNVSVKKEGYLAWEKKLEIQKEIVTQVDVFLFPVAATLSPITFSGAVNPTISDDSSKIAYGAKDGLWVTETFNLPIGFSREPRQVTDGDLTLDPATTSWRFSPDGRQLLLKTKSGTYLLDTGKLTAQSQRVNIDGLEEKTLADWQAKREQVLNAQLSKLPDGLIDILRRKATNIKFSPDEFKVLYTASESATIPEKLIKELPGSSTQRQERETKKGFKYVYDIKEDRNFVVAEPDQTVYWFPTSSHIVLPQKDKVVIEDYDGTNKQTVYSGSYTAPFAFPYSNSGRIIILTNLGSGGSVSNLYSLSLK